MANLSFKAFIQQIFDSLKSYIFKIKNERIRTWILLNIPFWLAAAMTGAVAVIYQKLFAFIEHHSWMIIEERRWAVFILTPVTFVLSWWLVCSFSPNAKGSGIPQVMASLELARSRNHHLIRNLLSLKIVFIKMLSSSIKAFGGGIIGREGPTIQIGASIFSFINNILPRWIPKVSSQNAILAGAASGLAAAFNTPLGGIVFAIEELAKSSIKNFKTALFTGVIISGIIAQLLGDTYLYFGYPRLQGIRYSSLIAVGIVAIVAGLSGGITSKVCLYFLKVYAQSKTTFLKFLFVLVCSFTVASSIYFFGEDAFGSGKAMMDKVLFTDQKELEWYTPLLRSGGMIASFVSGGAGGVFAPSLSAGASIGAELASYLDIKGNTANLLILCGMIGFLTGLTRSPITSAIVVLEMTDRHSSIFYFMVAAVISNIVGSSVDRHSFYERLKTVYLRGVYEREKKDKEAVTMQPGSLIRQSGTSSPGDRNNDMSAGKESKPD